MTNILEPDKNAQIKLLLARLQNVLWRYIADVNHRQVWDEIYTLLEQDEIVWITKSELLKYQAMEKIALRNEVIVKW